MKLSKLCFAIMLTVAAGCTKKASDNPLLLPFNTPFGVPPFEQIKEEHYLPAFEVAMAESDKNIEAIASNSEAPTFANTVAALDTAQLLLSRVSGVFFHLTGAETTDGLQELSKKIFPMLSEHGDKIMMNDRLFARVKSVYDNQKSENLTVEQTKMLDDLYKQFIRSGALLSAKDKEKMMAINKELSLLSLEYDDNVLAEINNYALIIDKKEDLAGLSESSISEAADEAKRRGQEGKWAFTISKPSLLPFLSSSENREFRRQMYTAYYTQGMKGDSLDNCKIANKIANLRIQRANLLGFKSHADYVLEECMAKTPANVLSLLDKIWKPAIQKAKDEVKEMQAFMDKEGKGEKLEAWDWWYYSEKVRKAKYDLDEDQLKPYFKLENVRDGAFMVANKLWGITFTEIPNVPIWQSDVKAFEVKEADGKHIGVLYVDYFPRPGKKGGAWMDALSPQYIVKDVDIRPVIVNIGNFTKPTADKPSLLTADDVETLFHEFGHALHGLLTRCNYISTSGTAVARDFVELPSQIMEHWAFHPEVLALYAKHYQTGEVIPADLVKRLQATSTFNQGFGTTELVAAAYLDMYWHTLTQVDENRNAIEFEKKSMDAIGLIPQIAPRYRTGFFRHIFSGGYSSGYYSYLWAEVLDADAFDSFAKTSIFDQATAKSFRENVLERGGSEDPMVLYRRFKGAEPTPDALLRNRGLK